MNNFEKFDFIIAFDTTKNAVQGYLAKLSFARKIFKLDSWSPGAGVFPIGTINYLRLKRRRYSDFKNNFVIMKRER